MRQHGIVNCRFSTVKKKNIHLHQDIEIIYVLDGFLHVITENEQIGLGVDEFVLINSNVRHESYAEGKVLFAGLFIDYAQLTELFNGEHVYFLCNSTKEKSDRYDLLRSYFRTIFSYYQTNEGPGNLIRTGTAYQMLYVIASSFIVRKGMKQYETLRGFSDERMNEIMNYLMTNYYEQISLDELADWLCLSKTYLAKYIKKNFGISFLKLLNNIRLEHAVEDLLDTDKSVLKIALDNGFPYLSSFNKIFREQYCMAPAQYRCEARKEMIAAGEEIQGSEAAFGQVEQYLARHHVQPDPVVDSIVTVLEGTTQTYQILNKNWKRMINIGHASDLLRYDVREQLALLKEHLDFRYVRFWNIMTDEMLIQMDRKKTRYNFSNVDKVVDYIIQLGMHPYVELGYKPRTIYSNVDSPVLLDTSTNQIAYIERNIGFLQDLVKHWAGRYGIKEVSQWYIELERTTVENNAVDINHYLDVFETIYYIFKSCVPDIKIGGAGFSLGYQQGYVRKSIIKWKKRKARPDFFSIYTYPYVLDEELRNAGRNAYSSDSSFLQNQLVQIKEILDDCGLGGTELHVTEWSFSLSSRNVLNDSHLKAAYVMKNLMQNWLNADIIGYWVALDIYSDYVDSKKLLFGGCGLISKNGIKKPVYYAYHFLNGLKPYLLRGNDYAMITCDGNENFSICCHNYKHFNFRYYLMKEGELDIENQQHLLEDNEKRQLVLRIGGVLNGIYLLKVRAVNAEYGNIRNEWKKLGYFNELKLPEAEYLKAVSQPFMFIRQIEVKHNILEIETLLAANEIQLLTLERLLSDALPAQD